MKEKPYPWTCLICCTKTVHPFVVDYPALGIVVEALSVSKCRVCGHIILDDKANHRSPPGFK
jgi:hypothetical protein